VTVISLLAIAVLHLFTSNLSSAIAVRAAHGIAAAPLAMMAIFYMIQAFPKRLMAAGEAFTIGPGGLDLLDLAQQRAVVRLPLPLGRHSAGGGEARRRIRLVAVEDGTGPRRQQVEGKGLARLLTMSGD